MTEQDWKKHLEPFGNIYARAEGEMEDRLLQMDAAELEAIIEATEHPTKTNCSWDIYQVRERVRSMARYRLKRLERSS